MNDNSKKSAETSKFLDNLAVFLSEDDLSLDELAEDLRARGLDPDRIKVDFQDLLNVHAPKWNTKAERERLAALAALKAGRETSSIPRSDLVKEIKELIAGMRQLGGPVEVGAYHQKFEEATDVDLRSLLEDLELQYELMKLKNRDKDAK